MKPTSSVSIQKVNGTESALRRFVARRLLIGSIIFGLFAASESLIQSIYLVTEFPSLATRAKFIYTLANNAALGLFYGDRHASGIVTPGGYMVYRMLPILTLIGAIWMMVMITKLLRGQEDNGQWELWLSGRLTAWRATSKVLIGTIAALLLSFIVTAVIMIWGGHDPKIKLSVGGCLYYTLAVIAGPLIALAIGAITSQIAATRQRADLYGIAAVIILFVMRSVGNVVDSLAWLKDLTPFGWIDKLYPFTHPHYIWLLPLGLFVIACLALAVYLSAQRDLNDSLVADSDTTKPKYGLLGSQLGFAFRSTRTTLISWLCVDMGLTVLIAAIDKSVAKSLAASGSVVQSIGKVVGNPNAKIEIAYLSAAGYFTVVILMILVTSGLGSAKEEEFSGRLDNFVANPVARQKWLVWRLTLLMGSAVIINLLSGLVIWALAEAQNISVGFSTIVFGGLNILGPVIFLLGFGALLYGLLPRITTIMMYALIVWSFTIDIVMSVIKHGSKLLTNTSLFHQMALVPTMNPDWLTFTVMALLGLALMTVGVISFMKRDLQSE